MSCGTLETAVLCCVCWAESVCLYSLNMRLDNLGGFQSAVASWGIPDPAKRFPAGDCDSAPPLRGSCPFLAFLLPKATPSTRTGPPIGPLGALGHGAGPRPQRFETVQGVSNSNPAQATPAVLDGIGFEQRARSGLATSGRFLHVWDPLSSIWTVEVIGAWGGRKRSISIDTRVRDADSTGCPGGATSENADASWRLCR